LVTTESHSNASWGVRCPFVVRDGAAERRKENKSRLLPEAPDLLILTNGGSPRPQVPIEKQLELAARTTWVPSHGAAAQVGD
jgi:hypothetical protein